MNPANKRIYETILKQIEENNQLPWQCGYIREGFPHNYLTGKTYSGRNLLMLWCANYNRSGFLTYNQAKKLGAQVRHGEHGYPIMYAERGGWIEREGGERTWKNGCAKVYFVFNISQVDGLMEKSTEETEHPDVDKFVHSLPIIFDEGKNAAYSPVEDKIRIPYVSDFEDSGEYYSTVFHEMIHWACAPCRLAISNNNYNHKTEEYSFDELVAELGSAFLRGQFKIDNPKDINNSAAYIKSWLSMFKQNEEILFNAMKAAEIAVDYLLNLASGTVHETQRAATKVEA